MVEDVVRELGYLTLGSRLKRIGERLQAQAQVLLEEAGISLSASGAGAGRQPARGDASAGKVGVRWPREVTAAGRRPTTATDGADQGRSPARCAFKAVSLAQD